MTSRTARTVIGRGQVLVASGVKTRTRLFSYRLAGVPASIISLTFSPESNTSELSFPIVVNLVDKKGFKGSSEVHLTT
jgi:hypothetical protein